MPERWTDRVLRAAGAITIGNSTEAVASVREIDSLLNEASSIVRHQLECARRDSICHVTGVPPIKVAVNEDVQNFEAGPTRGR